MSLGLAVVLAIAGGILLLAGVIGIGRTLLQRRAGRLVRADLPSQSGTLLRSSRFRISGRPDEIRELPDGRWVPVEVKSRVSPSVRPPSSHQVQVAAYCLLVEETTGRGPPFGLLRYGDGREFRVYWTPALRRTVLAIRRALDVPYDGRARPSPSRCTRCPWRLSCDRAAV